MIQRDTSSPIGIMLKKTIGEVAGIFLNADIMYADNVRILEGEEEKDQKSVFFKGSNIEWIHIKKV